LGHRDGLAEAGSDGQGETPANVLASEGDRDHAAAMLGWLFLLV
jgi:hypothetical protein